MSKQLGSLPISAKSLQGQFTRKYYDNEKHLDTDLEKALEGKDFTLLHDDRKGKNKKYEIGTVAKVCPKEQIVYLVAIAHMNKEGSTESTFEAVLGSLGELWNCIAERGQPKHLVVPVLGTGPTGLAEVTREEMIKEIIKSFIPACSRKKICEKLTIVISQSDYREWEIDWHGLGNFLRYNCNNKEHGRVRKPDGSNYNLSIFLSNKFLPLALSVVIHLGGFLLVDWGNSQRATFQPPYSFDASESAKMVEIVNLPADDKPPLKLSPINQAGRNNTVADSQSAQKNDTGWDKGSWTQTKGPYGGTITALHAAPDGGLLAGTLLGGIFRLADNGERWGHASEGLHSIPPAIRAFAQKGNTLYVGTDHGLHYSTNSGDSWQQLTDGSISEVVIIGDTIYIGRSGEEKVFYSNDRGKSWAPFDDGLTDQGAPTLFASGTTLFAQIGRRVFRLKVGENSWTKLTIKDTWKENTVGSDITKFVVSDEIVYAAIADGELFRSTDMGDSWQQITPKAMQDSNVELTAVGNAVFYINSVNGRVFQSTDAGDSWTMFNTNLTNQKILSIAALSERTLYVGTHNGVFRSTAGGESWTKANTGITDTDGGDLVSFRNALYTVTGDGVMKSVDRGDSWILVNDGLIANDGAAPAGSEGIVTWAGAKLTVSGGKLYAATCESNTSRWNPATSGIYCLAEDENSWLPILMNMSSFNGDSIDVIDRLAISGKTFYVIARARLYRWRVGEDIWTDLGLKVWHRGGFAISGRTIYFQRDDGKIIRSFDEGDTWTDVSLLPKSNVVVEPKGDRPGFRYNLQTDSFLCRVNLHFVGETIYANSTYDGVFRLTDGGETWRSINAGLPDGNVNIQLVDGTTIYGTNSHGIFRLTQGADSWDRITSTQHDVKSLAFDGTTFYIDTQAEGIFRLPLDE